MPPSNTYINAQLRHLIYYHIDCNLPRNALFFAGRLHAYEPRSSEAAYLLALCHLQLGQISAAYDYSRGSATKGSHLGCAYVFAQACMGLAKYAEGAIVLERCRPLWADRSNWGKHSESRRQHLPDTAAVCCLKGKLWHAHAEHQKAIESYVEALRHNPFMWDAFTALCDLGVNVRMHNVFKVTPELASLMAESSDHTSFRSEDPPSSALSQSAVNIHAAGSISHNDPFSISKNRINGDVKSINTALFEKINSQNAAGPLSSVEYIEESPLTSAVSVDSVTFADRHPHEPPPAPLRKGRALHGIMDTGTEAAGLRGATIKSRAKSVSTASEHEDTTMTRPATASGGAELKRTISGKTAHPAIAPSKAGIANDPGAPQRKSVRLLNQLRPQSSKFSGPSAGMVKEDRELRKAKPPSSRSRINGLTVGRVVSGNRRHGEAGEADGKDHRSHSNMVAAQLQTTRHPVNEKAKEMEAVQWLLDLCLKLGTGYFALSHYQCKHAIQVFQSIPHNQRETPWVLAQLGRAYYEHSAYAEAERTFARLRHIAPSRVEDMEYYSSCLWQLKSQIDLAYLAHELIDLDRQSPQAWCAVGNSFSLQRDHDQALKCFRRATQLDPSFGYAYTLQGHEYIANEEFDKATSAYRASISAESRHYNAWYGLGQVFEKQGKYSVAEQHYRTAASINPTNAALITCIGVMLERQRNPKAALVKYNEACELAGNGTLWRYKKAKVLEMLDQPERALSELRILKDIAPDDACVHFALGRVYKKLRQSGEAIKHFTTALTLDPKASHKIKEAMEELDDNDTDEDVDM